ncbi:MAG: WbqC family protein [Saprospiraceae bacterium]|nr:WbqC family protein [Saprospiraceae bacterium]
MHNFSVKIEACENYQKRSFRNRYLIRDKNGIHGLSIPLKKGKNQSQPITEVKISYELPWVKQHLHAIQTAYGKAPFFIYYKDDLFDLLDCRYELLFELNLKTTQWLANRMKIQYSYQCTKEFEFNIQSKNDMRNRLNHKLLNSESSNMCISSLDLLFHYGPEAYRELQVTDLELMSRLNWIN